MKAQTQTEITLGQITEALDKFRLAEARDSLYKYVGANLTITGKVEKVAKRDGLRLCVKVDGMGGERSLIVFADFNDETQQQRIKDKKIRKGSAIELTGKFCTFGETTVTVDNSCMTT